MNEAEKQRIKGPIATIRAQLKVNPMKSMRLRTNEAPGRYRHAVTVVLRSHRRRSRWVPTGADDSRLLIMRIVLADSICPTPDK